MPVNRHQRSISASGTIAQIVKRHVAIYTIIVNKEYRLFNREGEKLMDTVQTFFSANAQPLIWLAVALFLLIVEAATVQMVCIWFCVGAIFAVFASLLGASIGIQIVVFVVVSIIALAFTRKFVKNVLKVRHVPTNADSVVGEVGTVLEEINNIEETGRVRVGGLDWTARADNGHIIKEGTTVLIKAIAGVKVIVVPAEKEEEE